MKPTEQEIKCISEEIANSVYPVHDFSLKIPHDKIKQSCVEAINWAISKMQPEWVSVEDELPGDETYAIIWRKGYSPEQTVARQVFNMTHACYCFIDNSLNTYQIGEVVTHWSPLLEPPTK